MEKIAAIFTPGRKYIAEKIILRFLKLTTKDCCISCHDDQDEYISHLILIELGKNRYSEVCCEVARQWEQISER